MSSQAEIWPPPRLIRAARAMIGIDQSDLAEQAGVTRQAVIKIEADAGTHMDPRRLRVLRELQRVFEDNYGVQFLPETEDWGEGIRFKSGRIAVELRENKDTK